MQLLSYELPGLDSQTYHWQSSGNVVPNADDGRIPGETGAFRKVCALLTAGGGHAPRNSGLTGGFTIANTATGGPGNDWLFGTAYDDLMNGGAGYDTIEGGFGNDTITGGSGADTMEGGPGIDTFIVDSGTDTINDLGWLAYPDWHGSEVLVISANARANATLTADWIVAASTSANSGTAIVTLAGFDANVSLAGGTSGWTLTNAGNGEPVSITGSAKADTLIGGTGNDTLTGNAGNDSLQGGDGNDSLNGGEGANTLVGGTGDDTLTGNGGNDSMQGGEGNDSLNGGEGADTLVGGNGNDVYWVDSLSDVVTESKTASAGTADLVNSWVSISAYPPNVEHVTLLGSAHLIATGNTGNNVITGNAGNNALTGGDGADTLNGGAGNDTLIGGSGSDRFVIADTGGRDYVQSFIVSGTERDYIDLLPLVQYRSVFKYIGTYAFHGTVLAPTGVPELRYTPSTPPVDSRPAMPGILRGDVNGDGVTDFQVELTGIQSGSVLPLNCILGAVAA